MMGKRKQEVSRLIREFRQSPQGQRWQEWRQRFERLAELPTFWDNPTYQRLSEQVRSFQASPSRQALTELTQQFQDIEPDDEMEPPQQLPLRAGRPKKLAPEDIAKGIAFLNGQAMMEPQVACGALLNQFPELKALEVSDRTLQRNIVSKAWRR
jgi:hypothetical protein